MYKTGTMLIMTACSPLHAGAAAGVGAIDLPIQREECTSWPIIQGGGLKGAMRDRCETGTDMDIDTLFGPWKKTDHGGALGIAEAELLLFPVRSLKGVYAHATCPLALKRFRRGLKALEQVGWKMPSAPAGCPKSVDDLLVETAPRDDEVLVPYRETPPFASPLVIRYTTNTGQQQEQVKQVILEEIGFKAKEDEKLYWLALWLQVMIPEANDLEKHLLLVSDDTFTDFVRHSTDVITRNRIDDTKGIVEEGALWTEERLPRETVLYAPIFAADSLSTNKMEAGQVLKRLKELMPEGEFLWIGGDTTVGSGLTAYRFS